MLRKKDITYPITFTSFGVGKFTMIDDRNGKLVDRDGQVRDIQQNIVHFINQHNTHNPDNDPQSDYHYVMGVKVSKLEIAGGVCSVEDMPLCARLTGVEHDEKWIDISIQPVLIEVDGDTVTFLLHHTSRRGAFAGEVSMKKGTKIRWEKA